ARRRPERAPADQRRLGLEAAARLRRAALGDGRTAAGDRAAVRDAGAGAARGVARARGRRGRRLRRAPRRARDRGLRGGGVLPRGGRRDGAALRAQARPPPGAAAGADELLRAREAGARADAAPPAVIAPAVLDRPK